MVVESSGEVAVVLGVLVGSILIAFESRMGIFPVLISMEFPLG
jgi:hypothetical protein